MLNFKNKTIFLFLFILFETSRSSIVLLNLKKCCDFSEYFKPTTDGQCYSPLTNNTANLNNTTGEALKRKLLSDFFYHDINHQNLQNNSTKNDFEIEKFTIARPICQDDKKKRILHKLSPGHIIPSSKDLFLVSETPWKNETGQFIIHKQDFCIDWNEDEDFFLELCIPNCYGIPQRPNHIGSSSMEIHDSSSSSTMPCLRKCCLPHQILDVNKFTCINVQSDTKTELIFKDLLRFPYNIDSNGKSLLVKDSTETYRKFDFKTDNESGVNKGVVITQLSSTLNVDNSFEEKNKIVPSVTATHSGIPDCKIGSYEVDFRDREKYSSVSLLSSGYLQIETVRKEKQNVFWEEFCIDKIIPKSLDDDIQEMNVIDEGIDINKASKVVKEGHHYAIVCFPHEDEDNDVFKPYRSTLYPVLTGISSIFLLSTSIIYLILWKDLNLPGWLQFSYSNCLLVTFTLLTIVQIWSEEIRKTSQLMCKFVGYTLHFFFLSSFFWLTSMNVDLWCSFRNTPIMTSFGGRNRRKKRYIGFAFFSIVIPFINTSLAVFLDGIKRKEPNSSETDSLVTTEIGVNSCAINIQNKMAHLYYFYGEVGVLLVVNLLFFFCTILCLRERHKETKFAHRQCTASDSSDLQRFRLFTRLFFIMGILWIFELISWLTDYLNVREDIRFVFIVTDCLNALQGVAIFIMFVWKPHTWKQLRKKFRKVLQLESQTSLMGPNTVKSSLKSSTKSSSISSKTAVSPTTTSPLT